MGDAGNISETLTRGQRGSGGIVEGNSFRPTESVTQNKGEELRGKEGCSVIDLAEQWERIGTEETGGAVSIPDNLPNMLVERWHECLEVLPSESYYENRADRQGHSFSSTPPVMYPPKPKDRQEEDRWNLIMNKLTNIENNTGTLSRDVSALTEKVEGQAVTLKEVKATSESNEQKINHLYKSQETLLAEMDQKLENKFRIMEASIQEGNAAFQAGVLKQTEEKVKEVSQELKDDFLQEKCTNRKLNLLLIGIKETEGENLLEVITSIFTKKMALKDIEVDVAYRLGKTGGVKPRPVLVRFPRMAPRQRVWFSKSKLKSDEENGKIWINEDLPKAVKHAQRTFYRVLQKARSLKGRFEGAHIMGQSLIIDGKAYGEDNLESLPDILRPSNLATLQSEKAVAFFGRFSPLSNHHPSPFYLEENHFSCMEQFLAWRRASLSGDQSLISRALSEADPVVYKGILTELRNNKSDEWSQQLHNIALTGLRAKFQQNPTLAHFLCSTHPKLIGEASLSKRWGIGLSLIHPDVLQPEKWPAKGNLLGNSLVTIREELIAIKNA